MRTSDANGLGTCKRESHMLLVQIKTDMLTKFFVEFQLQVSWKEMEDRGLSLYRSDKEAPYWKDEVQKEIIVDYKIISQ